MQSGMTIAFCFPRPPASGSMTPDRPTTSAADRPWHRLGFVLAILALGVAAMWIARPAPRGEAAAVPSAHR